MTWEFVRSVLYIVMFIGAGWLAGMAHERSRAEKRAKLHEKEEG